MMVSVAQLVELQNQFVGHWHLSEMNNPYQEGSLHHAVCSQHQFNFLLWHEEDLARSRDVADSEIARVKRSIDRYNQQRNDWIERVDDLIADLLRHDGVFSSQEIPLNTETPGAAIDRLSILSLRIYHLREQVERTDVDENHLKSVAEKLAICQLQQHELAQSVQQLIDDLWAGRKRHRTYRQLKMYNDPTLNPFLYKDAAKKMAPNAR
jgi:hypothetical protein